MNKAELISAVAGKAQVSKSEAERIMNAFISVVNENISNSNGIRIMGFGTLGVVHRKARSGRNPVTGEPIFIESRNAPVFKASKELREAANRLPQD
jgi:DNA-binding protein HU-beta